MRFLFVMLSCVWLLFGWASFSALRYSPPLPPPWTVEEQLDRVTLPQLDQRIHQCRVLLEDNRLPAEEAVNLHFKLYESYWLKAYYQRTRAEQSLLLKQAVQECLIVLRDGPDDFWIQYCIADLYHQLREYKKAEEFYQKSLRLNPTNEYVNRRYHEMIEERERTERS